jgi:hypothetical protein
VFVQFSDRIEQIAVEAHVKSLCSGHFERGEEPRGMPVVGQRPPSGRAEPIGMMVAQHIPGSRLGRLYQVIEPHLGGGVVVSHDRTCRAATACALEHGASRYASERQPARTLAEESLLSPRLPAAQLVGAELSWESPRPTIPGRGPRLPLPAGQR